MPIQEITAGATNAHTASATRIRIKGALRLRVGGVSFRGEKGCHRRKVRLFYLTVAPMTRFDGLLVTNA
ncbi:hypothetical protein GCM10009624_26510 [Gordonia sinesedis]